MGKGLPGAIAATFKFVIGGIGTGQGLPGLVAATEFAIGGIGIGIGVPGRIAATLKFVGGIGMGIGVPGHPAQTAAAKNNVITIFCSAFLRIFSLLFSSEYSDGFCRLTDGRDRGPIVLFKMVGQKSIGRAYRKLRGGFYWLCYCASRHSLNRNEKRN